MSRFECNIKVRHMSSQFILGIKRALFLMTLSLLAACSGGSGSSPGATTPSGNTSITGTVMDGYVFGATVCLDLNGNGICDTNEPTTITGTNGSYSFAVSPGTNLSNLNVIAQVNVGAIDSDNPGTRIASPFQLLALATQPSVVSPLTTLVSQYMAANPGLSPQGAATQVVTALGLPTATNLFEDYVADSNTALHNVAQLVNTVIQNSHLGTAPAQASLTAAIDVAAAYAVTAYTATGSISNLLDTAAVAAANATGNIINNIPPPSDSSQDNLALFTQLNSIRQASGAGMVVQNPDLDTAASNHANYLVNNNFVTNVSYLNSSVDGILGGHCEDSSMPGYTGSTPQARATAAGYALGTTGTVSELLSFGAASGSACGASIEDSVYHLVQLISPFVEMGLSFNGGIGSGPVCDIELGIAGSESGQLPASGSWVSYPADGQTNVAPKFYNQAESPVPAPDLQLAGHPIVISMYNQSNPSLNVTDIILDTFTLTSGGTPVNTRVLAQSGVTSTGTAPTADANISGPGILVLLPTSPLNADTSYTVTFSATVKGVGVDKSWSFKTGSMN
ncbi:MAG: hypothetical protein WB870_13330 [Gallionellaceae bacterium]